MRETHRPTTTDVELFMEGIGYPVKREAINEVYPVFFQERRVFRIADRVYKVRPHDSDAEAEFEILRHLIPFYHKYNKHLGRLMVKNTDFTRYLIIDMPYIGRNINDIAIEMDINAYNGESGHSEFSGLTKRGVVDLIHRLHQDQLQFSRQHGKIHCDIMQNRAPNNVLYHLESNRLYLIDAEAYAPADRAAIGRFEYQIKALHDYMLSFVSQ